MGFAAPNRTCKRLVLTTRDVLLLLRHARLFIYYAIPTNSDVRAGGIHLSQHHEPWRICGRTPCLLEEADYLSFAVLQPKFVYTSVFEQIEKRHMNMTVLPD